jgi:hypothetical protein
VTLAELRPAEFSLVQFDAARLRELFAAVSTAVGLPDDVAVTLEVDEVLPNPIAASVVAVGDDGAVEMWFSGGAFEDPQHQGKLHEANTRCELAAALLRAQDRRAGFADAPGDAELTERQRAIWDASAEGRVNALGGFSVREPRRRYTFRLYGGFNDVAEAEYARLWSGAPLTWSELLEIDARLEAADTRPKPKKPRVAAKPSIRQPSAQTG